MLFAPSGKGRKIQKKGEKGRFRPISGTGGQTPLKPPFVTPPFAAAQGTFSTLFDTPGGEAREDLFQTFWGFRSSGVWRLLYMAVPIVSLGGACGWSTGPRIKTSGVACQRTTARKTPATSRHRFPQTTRTR